MQTIISADSHVIESPDVFTGLVEQFGDEAPRVMTVGDQVDAIVIPARGMRGIGVGRLGLAGLRVREDGNFERRHGHKPEATDLQDPKIQEVLALGYKGLQPGLRDGAMRGAEQDIDGVAMEFLYPGFFGMFSLKNTQLQVALQRNYNDWIFDHAAAMGEKMQERLAEFTDHPLVGDVRGVGLLGAVELVANKETKEAFAAQRAVGAHCMKCCENNGLILRAMGDTMAFCPPLIISADQLDELFTKFEQALNETLNWVG